MPKSDAAGISGTADKTPGKISAPKAVYGIIERNFSSFCEKLSFFNIKNGINLGI
jgi:hypothetical protein